MNDSIEHGWIKIHRKFVDWRFFHNAEMVKFWLHLLLQTHHGDKPVFDGYGNKIVQGQFSTGTLRLAKETKMNRGKIERFLKKLENEKQIVKQTTNQCTIITIVRWDDYQNREANRETSVKRAWNDRETSVNRTRMDKNEKNEKNIPSFDFEAVFQEYPQKKGKKIGIEKCQKLIKTQKQYDELLAGVKNFTREWEGSDTPLKFVKHFSTFINQETWKEYSDYKTNEEILLEKLEAIDESSATFH